MLRRGLVVLLTWAVVALGAAAPALAAPCGVACDPPPPTAIGDASVTRPAPGRTTTMTFTFSLAAAYDRPETFSYATSDVTAVAGRDYRASSGQFTLTPGQTSKSLPVTVLGGAPNTPTRTFQMSVRLLGDAGTSVEAGTANGRIVSQTAGSVDRAADALLAASARLRNLPTGPAGQLGATITQQVGLALCRLAGRTC
jgi:hypothetical protein